MTMSKKKVRQRTIVVFSRSTSVRQRLHRQIRARYPSVSCGSYKLLRRFMGGIKDRRATAPMMDGVVIDGSELFRHGKLSEFGAWLVHSCEDVAMPLVVMLRGVSDRQYRRAWTALKRLQRSHEIVRVVRTATWHAYTDSAPLAQAVVETALQPLWERKGEIPEALGDVLLTVFCTSEHLRRMLRKSFGFLFPTYVIFGFGRHANLDRELRRTAQHGGPEHFPAAMGVIVDGRDIVAGGHVTQLGERIAAACAADPVLRLPLVVILPDTGKVPEADRDALVSFCAAESDRVLIGLPKWSGNVWQYDEDVRRIVTTALMPSWLGTKSRRTAPKKRKRSRSHVRHCATPPKRKVKV
jgi:hypothetical protein